MMRKRYELKDLRLYKVKDAGDGDAGEGKPSWPVCGVEFSMLPDDDMAGADVWPETEISFAVPENDMPRVKAWFTNDYHGVTLPESPTLRKNMATAVRSALSTFFASATSLNYFTSPVRVGICYRLHDGTLTPMQEITVAAPAFTAPRLPIVNVTIGDKFLYTTCQVRERPARLAMKISNAANLGEYEGVIRAIEVYCTAQSPLYDPACEVAGLRDISIDGIRKQCWHYDSYAEAEVRKGVEENTDFRLITSIPFEAVSEYADMTRLTLGAGTLSRFSSLPRPDTSKDTAAGEEDGLFDITAGWQPRVHFMTEPLDLSYPEDRKRLRGVILRGVFDRKNVVMRLYGSPHREGWRLLADWKGAGAEGFCGVRYRWFRVEIEAPMRGGDFLEALTFTFSF